MGMIIDADLGLGAILDKGKMMLGPGSELQKFIDSTVLNGVEPYVPRRSGTLTKNGILNTTANPGSGYIDWTMPYARYLWYGKLMVDPTTRKGAFYSDDFGFWSRPGVKKDLTDTDLKFDQSRHPFAGAKWAERYTADHLTELSGMVQRKADQLWNS